jgi:uncharacterized membrane protein
MSHTTERERYKTNTQDLDWNEEQAHERGQTQNIGEVQQQISIAVGGGFLAAGLSRRSWTGAGLSLLGCALLYRGFSGYCALFHAAGIDMSGDESLTNSLGRRKIHTARATKIRRTIEVHRSAEELYHFWRSFDNLPRVMSHLESVQVINDQLSHWKVKAMSGAPSVEWDAEIINDVKNERIGWRSLHDADVDNTGSVEFKPVGDGQRTEVTVTLQYEPPAGRIGSAVAKWLGEDPENTLAHDLQQFKSQIESERYAQALDRR